MFQRPSEKRYAHITEEYMEAIQRGIPQQIRELGDKRLHAALDMEENRIIPDVTETIELLDPQGDVLFRKRAGLLGARITKEKVAAAVKQGGTIMTHNHPALYSFGVIKQPPSFSDFRFAWYKDLTEVRAATATGTYEIKINCPHTKQNFDFIQDLYVRSFKKWAYWVRTRHPELHGKFPVREMEKKGWYEYSKPASDPLGIIWSELCIHAWVEVSNTGMVTFTLYPEPNIKTSLADWGGMFIPGKKLPPVQETAPMPPAPVKKYVYEYAKGTKGGPYGVPTTPRKSLSDYTVPTASVPVVPSKYMRRRL